MGSLVNNVPIRFAWLSLVLAVVCVAGGWYTAGFYRELLISLFGTFGGLAVGLFVINFYIDKNSRKIAALPLALLIETAVNRLHNDYFVGIAHAKFGSTKFGSMLDEFGEANREPTAFSPEDRQALREMILKHKDQIKAAIQDLDQRFSTLITVLGWSFDAQVVAAALEAKRNASELIAALDTDDPDQEYRLIKHWFDVDATANSTRSFLAKILGYQDHL
ncbi:hypothetical protein K3177_00315 [Qipengyuania sp. GH25]|uniref:Uncharacterized protein n=1 Tax=Qipengyuania pacifica TaxID=2860199 RepID=A0ABS7JGT7_9SPHN|nr:hypothetical protein [Qipengyuania aerophila]MBX7486947.1 hypothetical protein [Qipengyuania aerophila]